MIISHNNNSLNPCHNAVIHMRNAISIFENTGIMSDDHKCGFHLAVNALLPQRR